MTLKDERYTDDAALEYLSKRYGQGFKIEAPVQPGAFWAAEPMTPGGRLIVAKTATELEDKIKRHCDPRSPDELEAEFPGWHAWKGVNQLWYARLPGTSPAITVERREDLQDLRDGIIAAIWRWENGPIR